VARLSEVRGNMNLPMVQEGAGWALWAGEWQMLSGMVEGVNRQDGRGGRMGEEAGWAKRQLGLVSAHFAGYISRWCSWALMCAWLLLWSWMV